MSEIDEVRAAAEQFISGEQWTDAQISQIEHSTRVYALTQIGPVPSPKVEYDIVSDTVRLPEERFRRMSADLDAALKYGAQVDALLVAADIENTKLRHERDALATELVALKPKAEPKTGNPLARRFRGGVGQAFEDRS